MVAHNKNTPIDPTDILPVLHEMDKGTPVIVCKAPPGAGKTFLSAFCIANAIDRRERVLVVTNSYEQAFGIAARVRALFPKIIPIVYTSKEKKTEHSARANSDGFGFATDFKELDRAVRNNQPIVTVVRKLTMGEIKEKKTNMPEMTFRWMVLDEAWQMADADFAIIAPLAQGFVMVGDSGQIPPIVRSDVTRWSSEKSGPQRPAPDAILARPHVAGLVAERPMSVSRRLPQRSAEVVQKIFYPSLFFTGSSEPRRLYAPPGNLLSNALAQACEPNPPGFLTVPVPGAASSTLVDLAALDTMAELAGEVLDTNLSVDRDRTLEEKDIVLLVARNQERRYLNTILRDRPGILVSTANKFQGAERVLSIVLHPLSGKTETTEFDSDAGRLCVMLSRHTHACFVIHRLGIRKMLESSIPNSPRALGDNVDMAHRGWMANLAFARWMETQERA